MKDLFTRSLLNPVLSPDPKHDWEALKVYNPGAVYHNGRYHLFYRAVGHGQNWHSAIGYATSEDGEHFTRFSEPILDRDPANPLEHRGLEDPRVVKIDDTFFMTYAAYDGVVPRLHVATSGNLRDWHRYPPAFTDFQFTKMGGVFVKWKNGEPVEITEPKSPECDERTKAGAIFPARIGGMYWMLFNEFRIWLANSRDGIRWHAIPGPFLSPRKNTDLFDNVFVEAGPPPIKTEKGWLVFYHGINDAIQYHLGLLLLDLENPAKILFRSREPIFGPRESYELSGIVDIVPGAMKLVEENKDEELKKLLREAEQKGFMPQVTFTPAAVVVDGIVRIFYGASDQFICTAAASLQDIMTAIVD
ncbi:MAG: hypothetical protein G01um101429_740 [Parcubacteria group bacterium Gr01-1014_29]|nr:MAG: hypothetical protein G01um101429_740 [Parcubacteria group bacterium Gr01-1014_29]